MYIQSDAIFPRPERVILALKIVMQLFKAFDDFFSEKIIDFYTTFIYSIALFKPLFVLENALNTKNKEKKII